MTRWLRHLLWIVEAVFVLAVVYFEPTHGVRGKLWREAFYQGKPTSWWRSELELWDVGGHFRYTYSRRQSSWEKLQARCMPRTDEQRAHATIIALFADFNGPSLLHGADKDARAVLRELLHDASPKMRRFARIGLKMDPEKED